MSMNFMVYGLGMLGFFVCGFASCAANERDSHRRSRRPGGTPTLHSMLTIGSAMNGDHGWGLLERRASS